MDPSVVQSALHAVCNASQTSVVVVASGAQPVFVAGPALRWLKEAGLSDRLGRPGPRLAALIRLAREGGGANGVFPLSPRVCAEVHIAQVEGPLCAVVVRTRPSQAQAPSRHAREDAVCALVAEGLSNKEIGAALSISERAVKKHVEKGRSRLHARNRAHLVALLRRK